MQAPHSAHESSTTAFSSLITIASRGHDDTHSPQPVHLLNSTVTAMRTLLKGLRKQWKRCPRETSTPGILAMFSNSAREGSLLTIPAKFYTLGDMVLLIYLKRFEPILFGEPRRFHGGHGKSLRSPYPPCIPRALRGKNNYRKQVICCRLQYSCVYVDVKRTF